MKLLIFGLSISSSWGNGHATLWRGLCKSLRKLGHAVVFFERNQPYYEATRDWHCGDGTELVLYDDWWSIRNRVVRELSDADVAIITSYCADAVDAHYRSRDFPHVLCVFYDLDTPVTLSDLRTGSTVPYLGSDGLCAYDLVLSFTGGAALDELRTGLGARRVAPLYGHVDPEVHRPTAPLAQYRADLSYLGTYARDRQEKLETLFVAPARQRPALRFVMGGAQYPDSFPWSANVFFVRHLPPLEHAAFFSSARLTLNVTRAAMARLGWCPSGRLFEAAACRVAIVSDEWSGLDEFYTAGEEILVARTTDEALAALDSSDEEIARIARRAYERTLIEHTSEHRAHELLAHLENARSQREPRQTTPLACTAQPIRS